MRKFLWNVLATGSIVPFQADTTFFAMKSFGGYNMHLGGAAGHYWVGAVIGQGVNWIVGAIPFTG